MKALLRHVGPHRGLFRLLAIALASKAAAPAAAFEMAAGFAVVEEGDERPRPGAALHLAFDDFYAGRAYYWGRTYGPVREETAVVAAVRRFAVFKSNYLVGSLGGAVMNERITLAFDEADETAVGAGRSRSEDNWNGGVVFGIAAQLPRRSGPFFLSASWDAHLFPAGVAGGLFLSTGRKQTLSVLMGMML